MLAGGKAGSRIDDMLTQCQTQDVVVLPLEDESLPWQDDPLPWEEEELLLS
jgi:hypothetical protein